MSQFFQEDVSARGVLHGDERVSQIRINCADTHRPFDKFPTEAVDNAFRFNMDLS